MATVFEEALETLKNAQKDTVTLDHLHDGSVTIHILPLQEKEEENRWVKFAEKMHRESPLLGQSEEVNKYVREFRDSFAFREE
jgi:hypothetical protein